MPTVQEYNRCLKECAPILGIRINLRSHKARFFFANEVTYNKGVESKTIGKLIGDKSDKAVSTYIDPSIIAMEDAMDMIEEKLFNEDGSLKSAEEITGISFTIAVVDLQQFVTPQKEIPFGSGILPDIRLAPTQEDFIRNEDGVLYRLLKRIAHQ